MPRGAVTVIAEVYCFMNWGTLDRLEQTVAGALSYAFVDGHAARLRVPAIKNAYASAFPGLALSAGNPPTNPSAVYSNAFYVSKSQVDDQGRPILPPPNSLKRAIKGR